MEHGDRGRDSWHLKDKCTEVFRFERDTQPPDEMTPPWYGTDHFLSKFLKWFLLDRTIVMGTETDVHDWYIKAMLFRVIPETPLRFGIYRQCKYTYLHCKTMKGGWKSVSNLLNSYCSFTTHMKTLSFNNTNDFQTFDYNYNTFFQFILLYRVAFMMKKIYILCSEMIFI